MTYAHRITGDSFALLCFARDSCTGRDMAVVRSLADEEDCRVMTLARFHLDYLPEEEEAPAQATTGHIVVENIAPPGG
jgi:hypothetical protein